MAKKTKDDEGKLLADLTKSFARGKALLSEFRALFPEAHALPKDDRRRSRGKLGIKEGTALRGVLDAALTHAALFKPVTLAAYEIAKPVSKRNPAVREKIAPLIDYYGANAASVQGAAPLGEGAAPSGEGAAPSQQPASP
jgi:hypothetical protein